MCNVPVYEMSQEEQLKAYKNFFEHAPVGLIRTDLKTGEFLMANDYAAKLLGYEDTENMIKNGKATDLYPIEQRKKLIRALQRNGFVEDYEIEINLPDTEAVWVSARFHINCDGHCIEGCLLDITELMRLKNKHLNKLEKMGHELDSRISALAG